MLHSRTFLAHSANLGNCVYLQFLISKIQEWLCDFPCLPNQKYKVANRNFLRYYSYVGNCVSRYMFKQLCNFVGMWGNWFWKNTKFNWQDAKHVSNNLDVIYPRCVGVTLRALEMTVKHSCVWLSFPKLLKLLQHSGDESHQACKRQSRPYPWIRKCKDISCVLLSFPKLLNVFNSSAYPT